MGAGWRPRQRGWRKRKKGMSRGKQGSRRRRKRKRLTRVQRRHRRGRAWRCRPALEDQRPPMPPHAFARASDAALDHCHPRTATAALGARFVVPRVPPPPKPRGPVDGFCGRNGYRHRPRWGGRRQVGGWPGRFRIPSAHPQCKDRRHKLIQQGRCSSGCMRRSGRRSRSGCRRRSRSGCRSQGRSGCRGRRDWRGGRSRFRNHGCRISIPQIHVFRERACPTRRVRPTNGFRDAIITLIARCIAGHDAHGTCRDSNVSLACR